MKFRVNKARIEEAEIDQLVTLEDMMHGEETTIRGLRDLLAHFLVGEIEGPDCGEYLPQAAARKAIGKLKTKDLKDVASEFTAALRDDVLPPASGGASSPPASTEGAVQPG